MQSRLTRGVAVLALVGTAFVSMVPARAATPLTPQQRIEITALGRKALGPDPRVSDEAIASLQALGEPAKPKLVGVLGLLLDRGRTIVTRAGRRVGDPSKAKALQEKITETRRAALENVAKLQKGERIRIAHENYDQLKPMLELLSQVYQVRDAVRQTMRRRPAQLKLWKELGGDDQRFSPENETRLKAGAEAVLGMSVETASSIPEFGQGGPPADADQWQYWFYSACRRIEAHNRSLEGLMSPGEAENIHLLNTYREMLGTLPLEADARLLQSARRHSKEMVDLGYFAHESPTPANKTHTMRMAGAGYAQGYSENIAAGSGSGKGAFWMWFDSPPHHQNMVNAGSSAIGVGQWSSTWTQNFGGGKRLMLIDEDERNKVIVKGDVLPPRSSAGARRPVS